MFKILFALVGRTLLDIHAAGGNPVVMQQCGLTQIALQGVVIPQVFVDGIGSHLAARDGADGGGRAGSAVAANENKIGPTINWILPDVDATEFTLILRAGEASSAYRLCYRRSEAHAANRQMNV